MPSPKTTYEIFQWLKRTRPEAYALLKARSVSQLRVTDAGHYTVLRFPIDHPKNPRDKRWEHFNRQSDTPRASIVIDGKLPLVMTAIVGHKRSPYIGKFAEGDKFWIDPAARHFIPTADMGPHQEEREARVTITDRTGNTITIDFEDGHQWVGDYIDFQVLQRAWV